MSRNVRGYRRRRRSLLLFASVLSSAGGPTSRSWAQQQQQQRSQQSCGSAKPLRVDNAAGALALMAAVDCADGGAVEAVWAGAITLDAPISVGAGTFLYITGEDDLAEAQGGSRNRLFDVAPSGSLALTGLKLSGGSAQSGGAIHSSGAALTLAGCVVDGNHATAGDGGAVWAEGGELTIIGGEFARNNATQNGGAVFVVDAEVVIRDGTVFEENRALREGGALYCAGSNTTTSGGAGTTSVAASPVSCSISGAMFASNNASSETIVDIELIEAPWVNLYGGGAAAFWFSAVNVTDSEFEFNYAQVSGGAIFGGNSTDMTIDGCTFRNNTTPGFGAAVAASTAVIGADTVVTNNTAVANGAGVFGWDASGTIVLNDFVCAHNSVEGNGGCLYVSGVAVVQEGTVMRDNEGKYGGCLYAYGGSNLEVLGGEFTGCVANANGAFMFASDGATATVQEASVTNNVAFRRGAVVYCSGDSFDLGGSAVTIKGGTYRDNRALELGGAIVAWGLPTVVTITGGTFSNNTAKFYGGFIFLEEGASMSCQGATISDHFAGDQGGGIYAQDATWVNSSCDLIGNVAPQGPAAYLTHVAGATLENHEVSDNVASGGGVLYVTHSSVAVRGLNFQSAIGHQEDSTNRAIQMEGGTNLVAERCTFRGWMGESVVYNANAATGSLALDSCDFSESTADMLVVSPHSDASIRNAIVGDRTVDNAAVLAADNTPILVDRALGCDDPEVCGPGACVDSALGVLCECLEPGVCLHDGGTLSIGVKKEPPTETYSPRPVYFELVVSAAADGATSAIWNLTAEADDLVLQPFPPSGVLRPGENVTIAVSGTPLRRDVGGKMMSRFVANSVGGGGTSDSTTGVDVEVESVFYFCHAFEYAMPADGGGVTCEQCVTVDGAQGLDCAEPGATLASMPVLPGYWRSSQESLVIHRCIHPEACAGATRVASSDDYCRAGYEGAYCASCEPGYGRSVGSTCHSCEGETSRWLLAAGALLSLLTLLFLFVAVVFLIGGLDAVEEVRRSVTRKLSVTSEFKPREAATSLPASAAGSGWGGWVATSGRMEAAAGGGGGGGIAAAFAPAFARGPVSTVREGRDGFRGGDEEPPPAAGDGGVVTPVTDFPGRWSVAETGGLCRRSDSTVVGNMTGGGGRLAVDGGRVLTSSRATASYANHSGARPPSGAGAASALPEGGKEESVAAAPAPAPAGACCGVGDKIKRWASLVPLDKLKILVVVWQILTVFPSITGADFPESYARLLSWIDIVNLDVGAIFSGTCVFPGVTFYQRLLLTTLSPIGFAGMLVLTYKMALRRAGIGSASVISRRAAWSRHMAAGLLLTFLVFTSTSTVVFKTFACDDRAVEGESYLRADYRLSCKTDKHTWYKVYAGIMILVYPIGIPLLYAYILWTNRDSLNPRVNTDVGDPDTTGLDPDASRRGRGSGSLLKSEYTAKESPAELQERLERRRQNPDLVPSMFLWKDFGPDMYYYEVIECGRRILLTGVLIFIAPHTAAQAAMACIFAFVSLLGFELLRPHLDPTDSWLYRLGCVIIFLSNFGALLIKVEAAGNEDGAALGGILIAVNAILILAVLFTSWFATQQTVDDHREGENALAVAKSMLTFEIRAADSKREQRADDADRAAAATAAGAAGAAAEGGGRVSATSTPGASRGLSAQKPVGSFRAGLRLGRGSVGARSPFGGGSQGAAAQGGTQGGAVTAAMVEELWKTDRAKGRKSF